MSENISNNLSSGFRTTGIIPVSPEPVLNKFPSNKVDGERITGLVGKSFMNFLTPIAPEGDVRKKES